MKNLLTCLAFGGLLSCSSASENTSNVENHIHGASETNSSLRQSCSLLEEYMKKPVVLSDDFIPLTDPLELLRDEGERSVYVQDLKNYFLELLKQQGLMSLSSFLSKVPVIYDFCGERAVSKQAGHFYSDFVEDPSSVLRFGRFLGTYRDFERKYRAALSNNNFDIFIEKIRALVPYSRAMVGKGIVEPVYFFQFSFDEHLFNISKDRSAQDRIRLDLSILGHEFAHVLFLYEGPRLQGRKINFSAGAMPEMSEQYGRKYESAMLKRFPHLYR